MFNQMLKTKSSNVEEGCKNIIQQIYKTQLHIYYSIVKQYLCQERYAPHKYWRFKNNNITKQMVFNPCIYNI